MSFWLLSALVLAGPADSANAVTLSGAYIEARTCDVWTGPCFANAEMNIGGKHAVLGWKVEKGKLNDVRLDGLSVVVEHGYNGKAFKETWSENDRRGAYLGSFAIR